MAYTNGTASGYRDLLDRFRNFLDGTDGVMPSEDQWVVERNNTHGDGEKEVIFRGPGSTSQDQFHVGALTISNDEYDAQNWRIAGFGGFDSGLPFLDQPGRSPAPGVPLWGSDIPYWFIGNKRRSIMIAKVSDRYMSVYLGYILPYALPNQQPHPLYVGGNLFSEDTINNGPRWDRSYAYEGHEIGSFFKPAGDTGSSYGNSFNRAGACFFRTAGGEWYHVSAHSIPSKDSNLVTMHPYNRSFHDDSIEMLRDAPDGTKSLLPVTVAGTNAGILGELEGVFAVHADSDLSSEDTIDVGGTSYMAVADIYREGIGDYAAIRLE